MSEPNPLANKSKSFKDYKHIIAQKLIIKPPQKLKPLHRRHETELTNKQKQESIRDLVINKLIINPPQRLCIQSTKKIKELHNDASNPFFKFLYDETLNFSALSEPEKLSHAEGIYKEHLKQTFYSLKIVKSLQKYSGLWMKSEPINLPIRFPGRKTLVLDLDETLVHCMGQRKGHIAIRIRFPDLRECIAGVNLRPFLMQCMEFASRQFEVVIFTASHQFYADAVIDYLDPEKKLFHHRLYRESCVKYGNFNIKDLRLINRRLQDVVIVDNSVLSFTFQLDNGVPIIPWVNDPLDNELLRLIEYLEVIKDVDDIREFNRKLFQLDSFYEDYLGEFPVQNEKNY